MLAHLTLLIRLHPDQVGQSLAEQAYPLDDAITICSSSRSFEGLLYLREQEGAVREVIKLTFKLLDEARTQTDRHQGQAVRLLNKAFQVLFKDISHQDLELNWTYFLSELFARKKKLLTLSQYI